MGCLLYWVGEGLSPPSQVSRCRRLSIMRVASMDAQLKVCLTPDWRCLSHAAGTKNVI